MCTNHGFMLSSAHYQKVHQKVHASLEKSDFDAVVALSPENIVYLSGIFVPTHRSIPDRLFIALFAKGGASSLIACNIVERRVRPQSHIDDIRTYVEFQESPMETLADLIKERNLEKGKIGIELESLTAVCYQELLDLLPRTEFIDCSIFLEKLRMIKDEEEISFLKEIAVLTEKSIERAYELARPNDTIGSVKSNAISAIGGFGAEHINFCLFELMPSGPSTSEEQKGKGRPENVKTEATFARDDLSGNFKGYRTEAPLTEGQIVKIDLSGNFKGYMSDLIRLAIVGNPHKKVLEAYGTYMRIHREIMGTMQPGKRMCDIYNFCQQRFQEVGLMQRGPHIGHSIGTRHHEYPMISPAHEEPLVPKMVINLEPVAIVPGLEACRIQLEDTILITEDKPELLSAYANTSRFYIIE